MPRGAGLHHILSAHLNGTGSKFIAAALDACQKDLRTFTKEEHSVTTTARTQQGEDSLKTAKPRHCVVDYSVKKTALMPKYRKQTKQNNSKYVTPTLWYLYIMGKRASHRWFWSPPQDQSLGSLMDS
ncbi:Zinc Finger Protein Gli1 [Manis pentadactyla]|nr:Zinc Finger Protein Gli1 [Manis pentadactyla]